MKRISLPNSGKACYTLVEAVRTTGINIWAFRRDIRSRRLACIRRGGKRGKIYVTAADLEAYLERNRISAIGE